MFPVLWTEETTKMEATMEQQWIQETLQTNCLNRKPGSLSRTLRLWRRVFGGTDDEIRKIRDPQAFTVQARNIKVNYFKRS